MLCVVLMKLLILDKIINYQLHQLLLVFGRGILHQGTSKLVVENFTVGEYNSTFLWYGVDMLEPFQLQKAVQDVSDLVDELSKNAVKANTFDQDNGKMKSLLKMFSRWLVAAYEHNVDTIETMISCASNIDNLAVIAFPEITTSTSIKESLNSTLTTFFTDQAIDESLYPDGIDVQRPNSSTKRKEALINSLHKGSGTWYRESQCAALRIDTLMWTPKGRGFSHVGYVNCRSYDETNVFPNIHFAYNKRQFLVSTLHEVDIVAADISIQKEREMVMDFMFPFFYGSTSVVIKKPDPNRRKWRTLVDPFKSEVLAFIGIVLIAASVIGFLFNPFYCNPDNARLRSETYGLHTIHDAFWYMYGALLSQGGVNLPESNAGRTFVSCWWLFCIVIVATYCGNLIAFLTVSKDPPPFNTLEEMAKFKDDMESPDTQKTSTRKEFRAIGDAWMEFNKTDPDVISTDVDVHMAKVKEGFYGWIGCCLSTSQDYLLF
ncbi:GLRK-like protein [Mya arenaria]|uniref:GLRK-like protein n=1 Tax=Mya arenaria TaxID=6604 RepID=A0ABY7G3J6_MYAAR|nr:GLRK-like protein [Mya arenaria]